MKGLFMKKVSIGSRAGRLSMMQTEMVINQLLVYQPDLEVEKKIICAKGQQSIRIQNVEEEEEECCQMDLEQALRDGAIDIAVHNMKDMSIEIPEELPIVAVLKREDPREALLMRKDSIKKEGMQGLVIGASSIRRKVQLEMLYKEASIKMLQGSILMKVRRLEEGEYDGIIVSAAGAKRAGFEKYIRSYSSDQELVPAAGQGILAIQARKDTKNPIFAKLTDEDTWIESVAERAYVKELGMDSGEAIAAHASIKNNKLYLTGMYYSKKSGKCHTESVIGYKNEAEKLGIFFANYMRRRYES